MTVNRLLSLLVAAAYHLALLAQTQVEAQAQNTDSESTSLPSYVIVLDRNDSPIHEMIIPLDDDLFNSLSGKTTFIVNRTNLNLNSPLIKELTEKVIPMANKERWTLAGIELRGGASPEGPLPNNDRLARGRAKALTDFIQAHLESVSAEEVHTITVAEDYAYLLWLLEQDGDGAAATLGRILSHIPSTKPEAIKEELMKVNNGRTWERLLADYFPRVRAARLVLYFSSNREQPAPAGPELVGKIGENPLRYQPLGEVAPAPDPKPIMTLERRHMLSVSSNLLYDAFWMPGYGFAPMWNVALEYFPRKGHFTYRLGFMSPYYHNWTKHKFFQIRDYHLEARYYLKPGDLHTGVYAAAYANFAKYGIGLTDKKGWQGEGVGGALKIGYVLPLGKGRWRLDFHVAAGAFVTWYDPYVYGNPVTGEDNGDYFYDYTGPSSSFRKRNHVFSWFGPTEVGITLSYDLLYYRIFKKGASMRRKEVMPCY